MAEFPALPLWTDALIGDTYHLSPAQFGAYMRLLIVEWRRPNCDLPNDDVFLGRCVGDPKNWHRLKPVVMAFFTLGADGFYRQRRLLDERDFVSRQAVKSSAGGIAKSLKRHNRGPAKPLPKVCLTPAPTPTPTPTPEESKILAPAKAVAVRSKAPAGEPDGFAEFYQAYPRHIGRGQAAKAYRAALKRAAPGMILDSAVRFATAVDGSDVQFIAHPATWLNGDRWADDLTHQGGNQNARNNQSKFGAERNSRFLQGIAAGVAAASDET